MEKERVTSGIEWEDERGTRRNSEFAWGESPEALGAPERPPEVYPELIHYIHSNI